MVQAELTRPQDPRDLTSGKEVLPCWVLDSLSHEQVQEDLEHMPALPLESPQDMLFSRDRIGVPRCPEESVREGAGQVLQCQVDGSMGRLYPQNLSSHDFRMSSALLEWLQHPHHFLP